MRFLDRLALAIFSIIIFVLSVLLCLLSFGWIDIELITNLIAFITTGDIPARVTIGVCIVLILLALKCIFFESESSEDIQTKEGILLENDNGKLLVSRDTLENLATSVVKSFEDTENVVSKVMLDKNNNLLVFVTLFVHSDAIIKDLSNNLQAKIKQAVKDSLGLDVKEVNIKIRNIAEKKQQAPVATKTTVE